MSRAASATWMSCAVMLALLVSGCRPATRTTTAAATTTTTTTTTTTATAVAMAGGLVNLAHLNFLSEEVNIAGQPMLLTHIYSEAPRYEWVDASGEGIAALDDVARAAIVYLDFYRDTADQRALERARRALNFVTYLQDADGQFYNFVTDRGGAINRTGPTSYKSLSWWAMRGLWALAKGYAVFKEADPQYATALQQAYVRTQQALSQSVTNAGITTTIHGFSVPAWLPGGAADVTGIAVLALAEYQATQPNDETAALLAALADGLAAYQLGGPGEYPFGMHPDTINAPGFWHAWGSHQSQALARAGQVMQRQDWIDSAAREARTFFAWQLAAGRFSQMGVVPARGSQIAYGMNVMVQAFMNLYHATGDASYARLGGLAASWLFGNNVASAQMYDPQTGRGYDGIDGVLRVNRNAGAESTIEALMALQAVVDVPEAARYLRLAPEGEQRGWFVFEAEDGREVAGDPTYGRRGWTGEASFSNERYYELDDDDAVELALNVPQAGEYALFVSHMRRATPRPGLRVEAVQAPISITLDGQLEEWTHAPIVTADKPEQILRGAEGWRGPDVDSFTLRAMWDQDKLYLAAEVRDPQHEQGGPGPGAAEGDALWLYLDTAGQGSRLSSKLTLAQTTQGPQVWDWQSGFRLPNAGVAWRAMADGYVYEAAIDWDSLHARDIGVGRQMRIEVGRGFGPSAFMDLSGRDPDSAANLAPLVLVDEASPSSQPVLSTSIAPSYTVALGIALDQSMSITLPQQVSPDRDYLWLDRVSSAPIRLDAGPHTLTLTYAGADAERSTIVDAFLLVPMTHTQRFTGPQGESLALSFNFLTAELTWTD